MSQRPDATRHFRLSNAHIHTRPNQRMALPSHSAGTMPSAPVATPATIGELLEFDFSFLGQWIRAGLKWIALTAILGALAGFALGVFTKPRYTATASITINPANLQVLGDDLYANNTQADAQLLDIESKLRILTSGNVLARVVDNLKLASDPEFVPASAGFSLSTLLGNAQTAGNPEQTALDNLARRVGARRDDKTYVVSVSAWSDSPQKSVILAHGVIDAFQEELAASDALDASRAAAALNNRLEVLKQEVAEAESKAEAFRQTNKLQSSAGELVNAQSLTQINAQRNQARTALAQAEARYEEWRMVNADGRLANSALQSPGIMALRQQYSTLRQQIDAEAARLGPRHPTLIALRAQIAVLEQEIDREGQRLVDGALAEVAEARNTLAALDAQADTLHASVSADNSALIQLRLLERDAQAKATLYESFLTRTRQINERERIDTTNIHVISQAKPPASPSYPPRTILLIIMGTIGGLAVGLGLALLLGWHQNRRIRSARQVAIDEILAAPHRT